MATQLTAAQIAQFNVVFNDFRNRILVQVNALQGSRSIWSFNADARSAFDLAMFDVNQALTEAQLVISTGSYQGHALTKEDTAEVMQRLLNTVQALAKAVEEYNKSSPGAVTSSVARNLAAIAGDLARQIADVVQTPQRIFMWILIAGAAIFILPPILRTLTAYRKGGTTQALEEATAQTEAAREAVKSGAKKAGAFALKAGAAAATKNPALLMAGAPRRRRTARRHYRRF